MEDRLKRFASSQEDVFKAYWELTDKEFGGGIDQAKTFYDALQNMVDSNFYDSDDARTAKFMMDSVKNKKSCKAVLPEDMDLYLRDRLDITMNAIEAVSFSETVLDEFENKLEEIESGYRGFLDIGAEKKLTGLFRDEVQRDVSHLYVLAQKVISHGAEGEESLRLLRGLDRVEILLDNADLTRDNVSHNHKWIYDYLADTMNIKYPLLPEPDNS